MKRSFFVFITLLLFSIAIFSEGTRTKVVVAVVDFQAKEGISKELASTISDYFRTQLFNTNKYILVTRESMGMILKEQNFQESGCTSQECVIQMGQMLGVEKIFTGSLGAIGSVYLLTIKMLNIETGQMEKAESQQVAGGKEGLLKATEIIAGQIAGLKPSSLFYEEKKKAREQRRTVQNKRLKPKNFIEKKEGYYYMNWVKLSNKELDNILRLNPLTKDMMLKQSKRTKLGCFVFLPITLVSLGFCIPNLAKATSDAEPGDEYYVPDDEKEKAKKIAIVSGIIYLASLTTAAMLIKKKYDIVEKAVKIYNRSLSLRERDGVLILSFTRKF